MALGVERLRTEDMQCLLSDFWGFIDWLKEAWAAFLTDPIRNTVLVGNVGTSFVF